MQVVPGYDAGGTVGRDVSRGQGGDQAAWHDLVARFELPSSVDPADAPWPDRENLASIAEPGQCDRGHVVRPASSHGHTADAERAALRADGDQSAVPRSGEPATFAASDGYSDTPTSPDLGFIDFLDEDDRDDRYVPPPVPPLPRLDPVAKGAWTALFTGPGYLLIATMLGWQVPGWVELLAVAAFIVGFVVLVSRLGDGPSRRDGPDQGAVV